MSPRRTLKAGIPVSLSGQFQVQGKQALAGLQTWADDVNRSGGIAVDRRGTRWTVSVVHYDDASQPQRVRQATARLISQDRVDLLFGPYSSVLSRAAAEVAEDHHRLLWNQGGAADEIYEQGYQWVVGIPTPASGYLAGLLPLVRQANPAAATVALVRASPGDFPRSVGSTVLRQAESLGFRVGLNREYPATLTDFTEILEELRKIEPHVLVGVGRISNDIQLARQMVRRLPNLEAAAVVASPIQQFMEELGGDVEGFLGPSQWEAAANHSIDYGPSIHQVLKSFRRQGHPQVDYPMAQAYGAGLVAQACLEQAGTLDDQTLRDTAGTLDYTTFFGKFKVEPETGRKIGHSALIVQWQKGRKVVLWPPEHSQARLVYPWPGRA